MASLPDAKELIEGSRPLGWDGPEISISGSSSFAVEVFAGEYSLILALLVNHLPCLQPWDLLYHERFDVLRYGHLLTELAVRGQLSYVALATPCQSQSWGRLPPLRDWQHPLGLPDLTPEQRELTERGNSLAEFSARLACAVMDAGGVSPSRIPSALGFGATQQFCSSLGAKSVRSPTSLRIGLVPLCPNPQRCCTASQHFMCSLR